MTRLVDPSSGQVLISKLFRLSMLGWSPQLIATSGPTDEVDARDYAATDLYKKISCQFQETEPMDVTIREFLHTGDVSDEDDEEKMHETLQMTGVDKIIARFPKGLDAKLGPYPADPTPQSFLEAYAKICVTGSVEPWEAGYGAHLTAEIDDEEESLDKVVGGNGADGIGQLKGKDCAFSPGEWQKLCFARTLMKKSADLR